MREHLLLYNARGLVLGKTVSCKLQSSIGLEVNHLTLTCKMNRPLSIYLYSAWQ